MKGLYATYVEEFLVFGKHKIEYVGGQGSNVYNLWKGSQKITINKYTYIERVGDEANTVKC